MDPLGFGIANTSEVVGAHLDEEADVVRGKTVSQYALDVELDDLQMD